MYIAWHIRGILQAWTFAAQVMRQVAEYSEAVGGFRPSGRD